MTLQENSPGGPGGRIRRRNNYTYKIVHVSLQVLPYIKLIMLKKDCKI